MMESSNNKKIKITDLPIYPSCCKNKQLAKCASTDKQDPGNVLQPYVSDVRKEVQSVLDPVFGDSFKRFGEIITTSKEHTKDLIDHVRNDQNQAARATFITSAGFVGYLLGRRGFFRRTFFALIAAGSAAALCEPKLARDYLEVSFELAKKKSTELYEEFGGPDLFKNINLPKLEVSKKSTDNGKQQ